MTEEACGPKQPRRSLQRAYARSHHTPPDPTHYQSLYFEALSFGTKEEHRRDHLRRNLRSKIFRRAFVVCVCRQRTLCVSLWVFSATKIVRTMVTAFYRTFLVVNWLKCPFIIYYYYFGPATSMNWILTSFAVLWWRLNMRFSNK